MVSNARPSDPLEDQEMLRLSISLPIDTFNQITSYAQEAGIKRSHFAAMALVIGSRALARQIAPERFVTAVETSEPIG